MSGGRKGRGCEAPLEDQIWFIEQNAVALVRERNAQIERLRAELTRKDKRNREYKKELEALRVVLKKMAEGMVKATATPPCPASPGSQSRSTVSLHPSDE